MAYIDQLKKLNNDVKSLQDKKKKIIETRKGEIGKLAEKIDILEFSDEIIAGALNSLKTATKDVLEGFENDGKRFLRPAKFSKNSQAA